VGTGVGAGAHAARITMTSTIMLSQTKREVRNIVFFSFFSRIIANCVYLIPASIEKGSEPACGAIITP
jgi:hypothetical protein